MKVLVTFLTCVLVWKARSANAVRKDPFRYLLEYGYIGSSSQKVGGALNPSPAIRRFQRYAQIPVTGIMDAATEAKLTGPRCGAKDTEPIRVVHGLPVIVNFRDMRRRKRYVQQGTKWLKTVISYSLHDDRPWRELSSSDVERTLDKAFRMWQAASVLRFKKLNRYDRNADIIIKFSRGNHQDMYPFDGQGGTLAHGFYPGSNQGLAGDIHFDDDEIWTLNGKDGTTDFLWTTLHEIGHAIGLRHSEKKNAIMWPWFEGYEPGLTLRKDDIAGIQSIYGAPPRPKPVVPVRPMPRQSSICRYSYDFNAVMYNKRSRNTYFFRGYYVWVMDSKKRVGERKRISSIWRGLPAYIDAAYTRKDGNMVFFKGNRYWLYDSRFRKREGPYPLSYYIRNIRRVRLDRLDAAMIWDGNGRTYFFRKNFYWRYNERSRTIDKGYPRSLRLWRDVKSPVDGVMSWLKSKTFFFHRNKMYRFDNRAFKLKIKKNQDKQRITHFIKNCR